MMNLLMSIPIICSILLSTFDPYVEPLDREDRESIFEAFEQEDSNEESISSTSKTSATTFRDVAESILFALGMQIPDSSNTSEEDYKSAFTNWITSVDATNGLRFVDFITSATGSATSGVLSAITIGRDLFDFIKTATKDGFNIEYQSSSSGSSTSLSSIDANYVVNIWLDHNINFTDNSYLVNSCGTIADKAKSGGSLIFIDATMTNEWQKYLCLGGHLSGEDSVNYYFTNWTIVETSAPNSDGSVSRGNARSSSSQTQIPKSRIITWYFRDEVNVTPSPSTNRISYENFDQTDSLRRDNDYGIIDRNSRMYDYLDPDAGSVPQPNGPLEIQIEKSPSLHSRTNHVNNDGADLTQEMMEATGTAPINTDTNQGLNGLNIPDLSNLLSNVGIPESFDNVVNYAFSQIDNFVFERPSEQFINVALWLSTQMETIFFLTDFHQVFTMLCVLVVAGFLIGFARLWSGVSDPDVKKSNISKGGSEPYSPISPYNQKGDDADRFIVK